MYGPMWTDVQTDGQMTDGGSIRTDGCTTYVRTDGADVRTDVDRCTDGGNIRTDGCTTDVRTGRTKIISYLNPNHSFVKFSHQRINSLQMTPS